MSFIQHVVEKAQQVKNPDAMIGGVLAGSGSIGVWYRLATDIASDVILWGNVALVVGGVYLMARRVRRDRQNNSDNDAAGR